MLIDAALNTILAADAYDVPAPTIEGLEQQKLEDDEIMQTVHQDVQEDNSAITDLTGAGQLYDRAVSSNITMDEICSADVFSQTSEKYK